MEDSETVFGFHLESRDGDSIDRLYDALEESEFEENEGFEYPVYDLEGSRVFIYPRSENVLLLQKADADSPDHLYDIEKDFYVNRMSIISEGERLEAEWP